MRLIKFQNSINQFCRWCNWVSCIAVLLMMCVVCANVVLHFFKIPILGTYEYVTLISTVIISFGLAHTGVIKGHVAVDLVMRRFPPRIQAVVNTITGMISLGVFGVVTWRMAIYAYDNFMLNVATETMNIPLYPFMLMISFGCFVFLVVLINEVVNSIKGISRNERI